MANLTADRNTSYEASTIRTGQIIRAFLIPNQIVYSGTVQAVDANGRAVNPSGANAALYVGGFVKDHVEAGSDVANDEIRCELMEGEGELNNSAANAITRAMIGAQCYFEDNHTVGSLNTAGSKGGKIIEVTATGVIVGVGPKYWQ